MENEEYAALFKYCDKNSLLVCTWYGKLKTLYTPITVKVIKDVGNLKQKEYVKVTEIKLSSLGKTVFIIKNKAYYYHYFDIMTHL